MKSILLTICAFLVCLLVQAQTPQSLNYQAVARNAQGQPLANEPVTVQFSVLKDSPSGAAVYAESQSAVTNTSGLFTLAIGGGTASLGTFSAIDWSTGLKFLKVEINGTLVGTTQFLSVPYALFAEKTNLTAGAGISITGNTISNTAPNTDNQTLALNGNTLSISNGNNVTLPAAAAYTAGTGISITGNTISNTAPNTDNQTLSVTGNSLSISGGNNVTLPTSQWTTTGSDIYYNTGKVIIGSNVANNASNSTQLLNIVSNTMETALVMSGNGGSNHNSISMLQHSSGSGWNLNHKAPVNGGIDHQFAVDYYDAATNTYNYSILKLTPTGRTGLGFGYSETPPSKLSVKGGDINVLDIGSGVIMKSPNGQCWRMTVSNTGLPVFTSITCP